MLIETAKLAPRWNPQLAALHAKQLELGHPNRATLQVARTLVAYLLAVDKSGQPFQAATPPPPHSHTGRPLGTAEFIQSLERRCSGG